LERLFELEFEVEEEIYDLKRRNGDNTLLSTACLREFHLCWAVMEANGSALTNKYSEGLPRLHNYGGNEWT
jgi:glycine/serine hydroxymethyltransferase